MREAIFAEPPRSITVGDRPDPVLAASIGVVEDAGAEVRTVRRGDLVIATACANGGFYPSFNGDGDQGKAGAGLRARRRDVEVLPDAERRDGDGPPRGGVLDGSIDPGRVLDYETRLEDVADAYAAMDERRAIKSLLRVGTV